MFIVLFEEGKYPKVLHGVNPALYDQSKILINPVLPRGIPPHRWAKGRNCIEILPEPSPQPHLVLVPSLPVKPKRMVWPGKVLLLALILALSALLRKVL